MIGSLLYLTTSRPDISYIVKVCARYQENFKESHMIALKRIIKYVKTTADFGVWYSKDTNDVLAGYFDVDWVGNADDRKSTSGGCFYVDNNLVSWMSKRENSHYLLQKLSTSLPVAVVPNFYGCKNSSMITIFVKRILPSTVTILVPSTSLRIWFNILELNTLRFDITLLGSLLKMVLSLLSLFTLIIKRLICLPNLLIADGLNSFAKTLVSSP